MSGSRWLVLLLALLVLALALVFASFLGDEDADLGARGTAVATDDQVAPTPRRRAGPDDEPARVGPGAEGAAVDRPRDGRIVGRLRGLPGMDLGGCRLLLEKAYRAEGDDPGFRLLAEADAEGRFEFPELDPGLEYVITLEAPARLVESGRSRSCRCGDEAVEFSVRPVFACSPRPLDPSGLVVAMAAGSYLGFDRRNLGRQGFDQKPELRLHGLAEDDLDLAASGVGLFLVPRERLDSLAVDLDLDFSLPGYEPFRARVTLTELRAGSTIPRPSFLLRPAAGTRSFWINLSYEDGSIPGGQDELRLRRNAGWKNADIYWLPGFDYRELAAVRFRATPGYILVGLRDDRIGRQFELPNEPGEFRADLTLPRGGDIEIVLPPERAPYRLCVPVRSSSRSAPEPWEAGRMVYRDLEPDTWYFAATDRRGHQVDGEVTLVAGQTFVWQPF
ncbi:MAG: hypothetical protein H6807_11985 [Planctomycetes bacterium]|nr:hypothetical protein [Planctomycetota bacterium]